MAAISPACLEAFVLAAGICRTATFVLTKSKTASELPAKMLLACPKKKEKNRCMGGAGTERGGSPTTRAFDNPKTAADWQGYVSSSNFLLELLSLHSFSPAHV
jgi:hypothetical protein